ncbi:MAG: helicase C-terminal domain-containing protein [Christensenellales bacterium]|nr:helicase C-terminal domain-containing protein [Christensenellales bacterium]
MAGIHSVSVRTLAEFALKKGDLTPAARMTDRMNEGVREHRFLQAELEGDWNCEEYVSREECVESVRLRIHGRADALRRTDGLLEVLEIKSTVRPVSLIDENTYPEHFAQGGIYAYLICAQEHIPEAEVILLYANPEGGRRRFRKRLALSELRELFLKCARPYGAWISAMDAWKAQSVPTLNNVRFPFEHYRDGQRAMAAQVYYAMRDGNRALIEAPTGIGKTMAALFGAVKALGKGYVTALFYLTARTTGRRAAEQALERLRAQGLKIRSVVITAKEKCCPQDRAECFGCLLATDYYQRRRPALRAALEIERADQQVIGALAENYEICPYELSLDMSEQADVIICDYNYVFDPRVRLRRYFEQKSRVGLLIDEAHNLPDRAREMLSAELSGSRVEEVRRLVGRYEGRESPVYQALTTLLESLTRPDAEPELLSELPEEFVRAARQFADQAAQLQSSEPEVNRLMLDAAWFVRAAKQFDEAWYRTMILGEGRRIAVRLWCYDPSERLGRVYERVGGAALFSATLAPVNHYARMLGMKGTDAQLQLESPFPEGNLLAAWLPVSVRFQDRARTLEAVAQVIHAMAQARTGNYLACFPSFAYLNAAYERYRFLFPEEQVIRQESSMGEAARMGFISRFVERPHRSMVAFVVLGGVFAEGVDLPEDRLSGAAIVSTGIPQIGFERNCMQELYDDGFGAGVDVAYTYPGMRRVLQAAGRVIRTEADRGVVLLLDTRYGEERIRELLPGHWRLERIQKMEKLKARLKDFWSAGESTGC